MHMAIKAVSRLTLPLVALTLLAVALTNRNRPPDPALVEFLGPPCDVPCWHGLRVGETTYEEALLLLDSNPFVSSVSESRGEGIFWRLTESTIRGSTDEFNDGRLHFDDSGYLETINISIDESLGDLLSAMGVPENTGYIYIVPPENPRTVKAFRFDFFGQARVDSLNMCPTTVGEFLSGPASIRWGSLQIGIPTTATSPWRCR